MKKRDIEFDIDKEGQLFLIGIPPKGFYEELLSKIRSEEVI